MAPPPACVALAAAAGLLGGAPLAGASRLALSELDGARGGEAHSFQPLRAWTAAAAAGALLADRHGALPRGDAAPSSPSAPLGDVRTPSQLRMFQNIFDKLGGSREGGMDEESDGPADAGVAHINEHGERYLDGVLRCSWTPTKGRILRATRDFAIGEEIFREPPLHIVREEPRSAAFQRLRKLCDDRPDAFFYRPLFYWCAIQSLTKEQLKGARAGCTGATPEVHDKLLLLHHNSDVKQPSKAVDIIAEELTPCADVITIERMLRVWVLNCFEFAESPLAYSTHYFCSFMSHSCYPNAMWMYSGSDHVLRAQREVKSGDEVCISYLPEQTLLQAAPVRRFALHRTKLFWCDCERCAPGGKDLSRGVKCPECGEGTIFANTPAEGPAEDASLSSSHWVGACCDKCGHVVPEAQGGRLAEYERVVQEVLEQNSGDTAREVQQLEADEDFIDRHFAQHAIADLALEQIGFSYAAKRRVAEQRRLLEGRVEFRRSAYPGLSVAMAWALEDLGDLLAGAERASDRDTDGARRCYSEALDMLRLMFGDDDDFVSDVEGKLAELG